MLTAGLVIAFGCCLAQADDEFQKDGATMGGLLGAVACVVAIIRINGGC